MNCDSLQVNEAIILAGGLGTRLRSVVADLPKPMALIDGRPFLEYQIDYLLTQGIQRVILSVGYLSEVIINHFGTQFHGAEISYSIEESPRGTGGGLLLALHKSLTDSAVLVLNGDTWFPVQINQMIDFHVSHHSEVTVALRKGEGAGRYGSILLDNSQRIIDFSATGEENRPYINGGLYLVSDQCRKKWLTQDNRCVFSLEQELLAGGIQQGLLSYGFVSEAEFIDIGVPDDYVRASLVIK